MAAITMVTEPVLPLLSVLSDTSVECVVMGWRGVASGLTFLHTKVGLSHNNLSMLCVYVSTGNSQWKIGGLELAVKHSCIDTKVSVLLQITVSKTEPCNPCQEVGTLSEIATVKCKCSWNLIFVELNFRGMAINFVR